MLGAGGAVEGVSWPPGGGLDSWFYPSGIATGFRACIVCLQKVQTPIVWITMLRMPAMHYLHFYCKRKTPLQ